MSVVSQLQIQKQNMINSILNEQSQITKYEQAYESLRLFKESVMSSQGEFVSVNQQKELLLEQVRAISGNCRTAKKYASGMGNTLSGVGMKAVGVTYEALLFSIGLKLSYYLRKIESGEDRIADWNQQIVRLDGEIEAAKQAEQLAMMQQEEDEV